jgi:hypothetical protein
MGKANISFPEGLLEEIDRRAAASGTTRSGFVQEASARYIAQLDDDAHRTERRTRILDAMARAREIGRHLPPGPDAVTLIRELRDAPPRWERSEDESDER